MDRAKLAELRKKKAESKARGHKELLDSNASIKEAILALNELINAQQPYDDSKLIKQLKELKDSQTYGEDIKRLETALKESSNKKKLEDIIKAVGKINNKDVVSAVNSLVAKMEDRTISQDVEDYQPVRRVRKIGNRLVFDDDPVQVSVMGGGSRGVQSSLIENGRVKVTTEGITLSGDVEVDMTATNDLLTQILAVINVYVTGETPSGAVNGVNQVYTTAYNFKPNTVRLFLNGLRQLPNIDYLETGSNEITFDQSPLVNDIILMDYIKE